VIGPVSFFTVVSALAALVAAVYAWRFVVRYSQVEYRTYSAGRHLMSFTRGVAVVSTYSLAALFVRTAWHEPWVGVTLDVGRAVTFIWLAAMMVRRYRLLEDVEETDAERMERR
jgi:hypothetical protein